MSLDFSSIIKKRVPFVPYVQTPISKDKTEYNLAFPAGHDTSATMSTMSKTITVGHAGQVGTGATLEDMRQASRCVGKVLSSYGHSGHAGHAITDDDVEFFDERAARLEFCSGLSRSEAEALAFAQWQSWRSKRKYH